MPRQPPGEAHSAGMPQSTSKVESMKRGSAKSAERPTAREGARMPEHETEESSELPPDKQKEWRERSAVIAKQLVMETFKSKPSTQHYRSPPGRPTVQEAKHAKRMAPEEPQSVRPTSVVGNPDSTRLYNLITHERHIAQKVALRVSLGRIQQLCDLWANRGQADRLIQEALHEVGACFPGCTARVGLLQPQGNVILFTAATPGSNVTGKSLQRGEGVSFPVVDAGEHMCISDPRFGHVLDDGSKPKLLIKGGSADLPLLVLPLQAEGCRVGVLAIDRWSTYDVKKGWEGGVTRLDSIVRQKQQLTNLRDPDQLHSTRLWRHPRTRTTGAKVLTEPQSSFVAAGMVVGRVTEVVIHPRWGPQYTIDWEDGLKEADVQYAAVESLAGIDKERLGYGAYLDEDVVELGKQMAAAIARGVDNCRKTNRMKTLHHVTKAASVTVEGVYRAQLNAVVENVLFNRVAEVWEIRQTGETTQEVKSLAHVAAGGDFSSERIKQGLESLSKSARRVLFERFFPPHGRAVSKRPFTMPEAAEIIVAPFYDDGEPVVKHRPRVLKLQPLCAENLAVAKRGVFNAGHTDPFLIIKLQGKEVKRTEPQTNTVSPAWREPDDGVVITLPEEPWSAEVVIEVWDSVKGNAGAFLGRVVLRMEDLVYPSRGVKRLELQPRQEHLATDSQVVQGTISLTLKPQERKSKRKRAPSVASMSNGTAMFSTASVSGSLSTHSSLYFKGTSVLQLRIKKAVGLYVPDDSIEPTPYVIVYMNDAEVKRTPVVKDTVAPVWDHSVSVTMPEDMMVAQLRMEVWNVGRSGVAYCFGQATLNGTDLQLPTEGELSLPLRQREPQASEAARGELVVSYTISNTITALPPTSAHTNEDESSSKTRHRRSPEKRKGKKREDRQSGKTEANRWSNSGNGNLPAEGGTRHVEGLTTPGRSSKGEQQQREAFAEEIAEGGLLSATASLDSSVVTPEPLSVLHVHIVEAHGLAKADLFGKSDPFCIIKWNGMEVGRTKVIEKTLDPVWTEEKFDVPMMGDPTSSQLCVEVWDMDKLGVGDFLGQMCLHMTELVAETGSTRELTLQPKPDASSKKPVKGTITLRLTVSQPNGAATTNEAAFASTQSIAASSISSPRHGSAGGQRRTEPYVRLKVHKAVGLAKADFFGASDPYCVIKWNNVEVGRTRIIPKTLNPVWSDKAFDIPLINATDDSRLVVEVWDKDIMSMGDFLGTVSLRPDDLRAHKKMEPYVLRRTKRMNIAFQRYVQGTLFLSHSCHDCDTDSLAQGIAQGQHDMHLIVQVHQVTHLGKGGLLGSMHGVYVVVMWDGREVGRTSVVEINDDASWPQELFVVRDMNLDAQGLIKGELRLDICDMQKGASVVVGSVVRRDAAEILASAGQAMDLEAQTTGQRSPLSPRRKPRISVTCSMKTAPSAVNPRERDGDDGAHAPTASSAVSRGMVPPMERYKLVVNVHKATGLSRLDFFTKPDPFLRLRCCGEQFGQSDAVRRKVDPAFSEGPYVFHVPHRGKSADPLEFSVEVWSNAKGRHLQEVFLGQVNIRTDLRLQDHRHVAHTLQDPYSRKPLRGSLLLSYEVCVDDAPPTDTTDSMDETLEEPLMDASVSGESSTTLTTGAEDSAHHSQDQPSTSNGDSSNREAHLSEHPPHGQGRTQPPTTAADAEQHAHVTDASTVDDNSTGPHGTSHSPRRSSSRRSSATMAHRSPRFSQTRDTDVRLSSARDSELAHTRDSDTRLSHSHVSDTHGRAVQEAPIVAAEGMSPFAVTTALPFVVQDRLGILKLKVLEVTGLSTPEGVDKLSVVCVIVWEGREVGRTSIAEHAHTPLWVDAHFDVHMVGDAERSQLALEVWDVGDNSSPRFRGQSLLAADELMGPSNGEVDYPLMSKVGMDKKAQRSVQGKLRLCWSFVEEGEDDEGEKRIERRAHTRRNNTSIYSIGSDQSVPPPEFTKRRVLYALVSNRAPGCTWTADVGFCGRVAEEAEVLLPCVRGRDARSRERKYCLDQLEKMCNRWDTTPFKRYLVAARYILERCLKGADCYVGMLQRGGKLLTYVEATRHSKMTGHRLIAGEGVSFASIYGLQPVVVRENDAKPKSPPARMQPSDPVLIQYGGTKFPGRIIRWAGFESYDVIYDDTKEKEAGVPQRRLTWVPPEPLKVHNFPTAGSQGWPYVCVPIRYGQVGLGVIGMDGLDATAKGREDEESPEHGVIEFVCEMGRMIGMAVDLQRKDRALRALGTVARDPRAKTHDVWSSAIDALFDVIIFCRKVEVWEEYVDKPNSLSRICARGDFVMDSGRRNRRDVPPTEPSDVLAEMRDPEAKRRRIAEANANEKAKKRRQWAQQTGMMSEEDNDPDDDVYCREYQALPSILVGRNKALELHNVGDAEESHGKIRWLLIYREPGITWVEDMSFVAGVSQAMEHAFMCIHGREFRGRARTRLVQNLVKACNDWSDTDTRKLVVKVVDGLGKCFPGSDVYIGFLLPGGEYIEFKWASRRSNMIGMRLTRGSGVSFDAVDNRKQVVVKSMASVEASRLRVFGESLAACLPFLCTPLRRGERTVRGVIGVDAIGKNDVDTEHPDHSEFELLQDVGNALGTAIDIKAKEQSLRDFIRTSSRDTVVASEICELAVKALKQNILLARTVEHWCFPLMPVAKNNQGVPTRHTQPHKVVLDIHSARGLLRADMFSKSDPMVTIRWNDNEVGRTHIVPNSLNPTWKDEHFEFSASGDPLMSTLVIEVWDTDNGEPRKFLGQILIHRARLRDYVGDNVEYDLTAKPGQQSKQQALTQGVLCVSLQLMDVSAAASASGEHAMQQQTLAMQVHAAVGLPPVKDPLRGSAVRPYCLVLWRGKEVGCTEASSDVYAPTWTDSLFEVDMNEGAHHEHISSAEGTHDLVVAVYRRDNDCIGEVGFSSETLKGADAREGRYYTLTSPMPHVTPASTPSGGRSTKVFLRFKVKDAPADRLPPLKDFRPDVPPLLRLDIHRATELAKAEVFGKADPFVVITWNGQEVGRTDVIEQNLDPVWDAAHFDVPLFGGLEDGDLMLQVYDMNRSGTGLFMGEGHLTGEDIRSRATQARREPVALQLQPALVGCTQANLRQSVKYVQGELHVSLDLIEDPRIPPAPPAQLCVNVRRLTHIPPGAFNGFKSLFVQLKHNHKAFGNTAAVPPTDGQVGWGDTQGRLQAASESTHHLAENTVALELWAIPEDGQDVCLAAWTVTEDVFRSMKNGLEYEIELLHLAADAPTTRARPYKLTLVCDTVMEADLGLDYIEDEDLSFLQLDIHGAKSLAKVGLLGRCDPVCIVKWNDIVVGRTPVVTKTTEPTWPHACFAVDMHKDRRETPLCIEVRSAGNTDAGDLLGHVTMFRRDIKRMSGGPIEVPLEAPPSKANATRRSVVKSTLTLSYVKLLPERVETFSTLVKLQIHSAQGLAITNPSGRCDPYCIVCWRGKDVGRTKAIQGTTEPVWADERFEVRQTGSHMTGELCVEAWDAAGESGESFLGHVVLHGSELMTPSIDREHFHLEPRAHPGESDARFVTGYLSMTFSVVGLDGESFEPPQSWHEGGRTEEEITRRRIDQLVLHMKILGCKGLTYSSMLHSTSAYCVVKWGSREVGRTNMATGMNGDMSWPSTDPTSHFTFNMPSDRSKARLRIEVYAHKMLGGDEMIASLTLSGDLVIHAPVGSKRYRLTRKDDSRKLFPRLESYIKLEMMADSRAWSDCSALLDQRPALILQVHDATGLAKADMFGSSDPFCIVKWGSVEVGRTKVIPNTQQPVWENERFELVLPDDPTTTQLIIECFDQDAMVLGDFLGQVTLSCSELLRLPTGRVVYELKDRDTKHKSALVQGMLAISVAHKHVVPDMNLKYETRPYAKDFTRGTARRALTLIPSDLYTAFQTSSKAPSSCLLFEEKEYVVACYSDLRVRVGETMVGPPEGSYRQALVAAGPPGFSAMDDAVYSKALMVELQSSLRRLRGARQRAAMRELTLRSIESVCRSLIALPMAELCRRVTTLLDGPLLGCDMYVGLVVGGGAAIRYIHATRLSDMLDKVLLRGRGVSFRCLGCGYKTSLVIKPPSDNEAAVGKRSTKRSDKKKPTLFDSMRVLGDRSRASLPFVVCPLTVGAYTLGVLGCDNFNQVGNGRGDEAHPEEGVVDLLTHAAGQLGTAIDKKRRADAVKQVEHAVYDPQAAVEDVYVEVMKAVLLNTVFAVKAQIWRLDARWNLHVLASLGHHSEDLTGARLLRVSRTCVEMFQPELIEGVDVYFKVTCGGLDRRTVLRCPKDYPEWEEDMDFKIGPNVRVVTGELVGVAADGRRSVIATARFDLTGLRRDKKQQLEAYLYDTVPGPTGQVAVGKLILEVIAQGALGAEGDDEKPASVIDTGVAGPQRTLRLTIKEAHGLAKADLIGSSDPFVLVYWRDKEIDRTAVINNCLDPKWESEVFNLQLDSLAHELRLEVWDKDGLGFGDFLGQVVVRGEDLDAIAKGSSEPITYALQDKPDGNSKTIKGELMFTMEIREGALVEGRIGMVDIKLKSKVMELVRGVRAVMGVYDEKQVTKSDIANSVLRIKVVDARDLALPSAVCVVKTNGIEHARTNCVRGTVSPKWSDGPSEQCTFIFAPPLEECRKKGLQVSVEVWSVAPSTDTCGMHVLRRFLGHVALTGEALHRIPHGDVEYDLQPLMKSTSASPHLNREFTGDHVKGTLCLDISWVAVLPQVTGVHEGGSLTCVAKCVGAQSIMPVERLPSCLKNDVRVLRLEIQGADDLPRADTFGLSDPYCIVQWEGREIGRTKVIWKTLNPTYEDEVFYIRLEADELRKDAVLTLEMWDKDILGPGDFLGSAGIRGSDLLQPRPAGTKLRLTNKGVEQGTLTLSLMPHDPSYSLDVIEMTTMEAHGLANADLLGKSDPLVILSYGGKEVARTRCINDTLDPKWNETFYLHLPVDRNDVHLRLEVWDMDVGGLGDFLGEVHILADELLQPTGRQETYRLQAKPKQQTKLNLVQGALQLKWCRRRLHGCISPLQKLPLPLKHVTQHMVSDVIVADDPVAEALRRKMEGIEVPTLLARGHALAELCDSVLGNPAYNMTMHKFENGVEQPQQPGLSQKRISRGDGGDDDGDVEVDEDNLDPDEGLPQEDTDEAEEPENTLMAELASGQMVTAIIKRIAATVLRGIVYDRLVITFYDESLDGGQSGDGYAIVVYCRAKEVYPQDRTFGKLIAARLMDELAILRRRRSRHDTRQQGYFRMGDMCFAVQRSISLDGTKLSVAQLCSEALIILHRCLSDGVTLSIYLTSTCTTSSCPILKLVASSLYRHRVAESVSEEEVEGQEHELTSFTPPCDVCVCEGQEGTAHLFRCVEEGLISLHTDTEARIGHPSWRSISQYEMSIEPAPLHIRHEGMSAEFMAFPLWSRNRVIGVLEVTGVRSLAVEVATHSTEAESMDDSHVNQLQSNSAGAVAGIRETAEAPSAHTSYAHAKRPLVLEEGVLEFLRSTTSMLGPQLEQDRKRDVFERLRTLREVAAEKDQEVVRVLLQIADALREALPRVESVSVWQLVTDLSTVVDAVRVEKENEEAKQAQKASEEGSTVANKGEGQDETITTARGEDNDDGEDDELLEGGASGGVSAVGCLVDAFEMFGGTQAALTLCSCMSLDSSAPELKATAINILESAHFSVRTVEADASSAAGKGYLKVQPLSGVSQEVLSLLCREWYRALLTEGVEHFWPCTDHLVLIIRVERRVIHNGADKQQDEAQRTDWAIAVKGQLSVGDVEFAKEATRMASEVMSAIVKREWLCETQRLVSK